MKPELKSSVREGARLRRSSEKSGGGAGRSRSAGAGERGRRAGGEWKLAREWAVANGYTDLANVGAGSGDNDPVTRVNWYDVVKWCNAKSEKEGKAPVYQLNGAIYKPGDFGAGGSATVTQKIGANGYRLPKETEWEWAARGGRQTRGYTYSGSNDVSFEAWTYENSGRATHEVGTKAANELGLFDMSGNAFEWCWDLFAGSGNRRWRGGGWGNYADFATVSNRAANNYPDNRNISIGFRLTSNPDQ